MTPALAILHRPLASSAALASAAVAQAADRHYHRSSPTVAVATPTAFAADGGQRRGARVR